MLHITLEDGRMLELVPHRPLNVLNTEGDNWGNGSIDWLPDGLFLYEIVQQAGEERKIVAAVRDGVYITMDSFVDADCTLRFIAAESEDGRSMMDNTAKMLVNYAMHQLHPEYEYLQSDTPLLLGYSSANGLSNEELQQLNAQLIAYKVNPPKINSYLMNYTRAAKCLAEQGAISQAKYLMAQDNCYPLRVHEIDGFIQIADEKPLITMEYMEQLEVVSQEVLNNIGIPIVVFNVNVK
ncbi:MAG: hypothetical protein IJB37_05445 [Peptococcaceae bacterium]|nr:hypothetical protein [Peptococcaceae bacterium]MBQ3205975.1 hypothetical protein [Peptococcaceae bacterium]